MRESVVAQLKTSDENAEPKISGRVIDGCQAVRRIVESSLPPLNLTRAGQPTNQQPNNPLVNRGFVLSLPRAVLFLL